MAQWAGAPRAGGKEAASTAVSYPQVAVTRTSVARALLAEKRVRTVVFRGHKQNARCGRVDRRKDRLTVIPQIVFRAIRSVGLMERGASPGGAKEAVSTTVSYPQMAVFRPSVTRAFRTK